MTSEHIEHPSQTSKLNQVRGLEKGTNISWKINFNLKRLARSMEAFNEAFNFSGQPHQ